MRHFQAIEFLSALKGIPIPAVSDGVAIGNENRILKGRIESISGESVELVVVYNVGFVGDIRLVAVNVSIAKTIVHHRGIELEWKGSPSGNPSVFKKEKKFPWFFVKPGNITAGFRTEK